MQDSTFKMSDSQKYNALWTLLNPNYCAEGGWAVEYGICEVYDEYAVVINYEQDVHERVYYTKNDETDSLSIDRKERCYILDVNENEKKALDTLRVLNGGNYELVDETFTTNKDLADKFTENNAKIEELNLTISTLTTERDEANSQYSDVQTQLEEAANNFAAAQTTIETLTSERDALAAYKKQIEDDAKRAIIESYNNSVNADILAQITADMDKYTAEEIDMKLTYEQKKAHPEIFSQQSSTPAYVPKDVNYNGGLEEILARYEHKK